jgi:hypothetical protein
MKRLLPLAAATLLAACATTSDETVGPPAKEMILAVTADNKLIRFNGGQPQRIQSSLSLKGLKAGEEVLGIDFRVARNQLYLLASSGQIYRVKVADATLEAIGAPVALPATATGNWGFDFNPTVDRIRVVNEGGLNLRRHPDSGVQVDGDAASEGLQPDGRLVFDAADVNAGKAARIAAAGYTYNKQDEKLTTNYAIDVAQGLLVTQGTKEGVTPAVSPNTGRLFTVGKLGISASRLHFDISDVSNAAYIAADEAGGDAIYRVDLASGKATRVARVGAGGLQLRGIAIEP